jgi:protein SCO1
MKGRAISPRRRPGRSPRGIALHAAALLVVLGLLGTGIFFWLNAQAQATIGGPFRLVDDSGHVVTNRDFRGKYLLIYFGYTHCADICPMTLSDIAGALDALGTIGNKVIPLFITVDPRRDTPTVLRQYVGAISPRLVGLTGSVDELSRVEKEFHVYALRDADAARPNEYGIDHSALLYLIAPDGRLLAPISSPTDLRDLIKQIAVLVG